jgi:hypothetical protein
MVFPHYNLMYLNHIVINILYLGEAGEAGQGKAGQRAI